MTQSVDQLMEQIGAQARNASKYIMQASDEQKSAALRFMAQRLLEKADYLKPKMPKTWKMPARTTWNLPCLTA